MILVTQLLVVTLSGIFVEILCLVGWLSLNSLSVCAIAVRVEPDLHVSLPA